MDCWKLRSLATAVALLMAAGLSAAPPKKGQAHMHPAEPAYIQVDPDQESSCSGDSNHKRHDYPTAEEVCAWLWNRHYHWILAKQQSASNPEDYECWMGRVTTSCQGCQNCCSSSADEENYCRCKGKLACTITLQTDLQTCLTTCAIDSCS